MKRSDLLLKYKSETGKFFSPEFEDKESELYMEWLENLIPENPIQLTNPQKVIQLRFMNEIKMRMPYLEVIEWEKHKPFVASIPPYLYEEFLFFYERSNIHQMKIKYNWTDPKTIENENK